MLLRFSDCKERFGSPYQIEKAVREGRLFKMAPGVYSESGEESEIEVLQARYPKSVLSLDSAYYYYDMTDEVPEQYVLVTADNAPRISDPTVRQLYVPAGALMVGAPTSTRRLSSGIAPTRTGWTRRSLANTPWRFPTRIAS